jgi:hypothetical protein
MDTKQTILDDLSNHPGSTLTEICRRTGVAVSTARHHLSRPPITRTMNLYKVNPAAGQDQVNERVDAVITSIRQILADALADSRNEQARRS